LVGGEGPNWLFGGGGSDDMIGGSGRDVMTGGADSDTFVFGDLVTVPSGINAGQAEVSTGFDRVVDYDLVEDMMVFMDTTATSMSDLSISAVGSNSFVDYDHGRILVVGSATGGVSDLDITDFMFL
jgi:Ca2+-binding RTX toxin-like protein